MTTYLSFLLIVIYSLVFFKWNSGKFSEIILVAKYSYSKINSKIFIDSKTSVGISLTPSSIKIEFIFWLIAFKFKYSFDV